ncbi:MAG: tRNA (N6-isopentenyl adenosine(37)-C2)-methylthiotransferase MiaB [Eubacteriales bacterium]|nr:tRNA (N6-isopentenyl adenosine(37)-C2)-methylthiotransferase MiaB [Eubacteriales bacterium]
MEKITDENNVLQMMEDLQENNLARQVEEGKGPRRFFIQTFGCQQNENDSEKLAGILLAAGFTQALDYSDADIILINSCSIRENADDRLFGHLGILKKQYEDSGRQLVVGVCGCMVTRPQLVEKIKRSYRHVKILLTPQQIHELPAKLHRVFIERKSALETSMEERIVEDIPQARERKFRALVSIMYGCNHFCTYCVVPFARGRQRSRRAGEIIREVQGLAAEGFSEIMLLGQNVNAWGLDSGHKALKFARSRGEAELLKVAKAELSPETFPELLAALAQIPGIKCIRYMSPHPRDFTAQMVSCLKLFPEVESRLHLPLQSGSDKILKDMNRGYDLESFRQLVNACREVRPELALTTDIIVGFPSETESDFEATLAAVEEFKFQSAYTFIFSPRPGTRAAKMPELPADVTQARFKRLLELQNALTYDSYKALLGSTREVLVEGPSKQQPGVYTARDHAFHLFNLSLPPNRDWEGERLMIKVSEARPFSAEAELSRVLSA